MSAGRLVNLGSLCVDHVYRVDHLVCAGETLASLDHAVYPGGKGLNQSLAAARAGARVTHVGVVGSDGAWLVDVLNDAGVDTRAVRIADSASGHAVIQVDPSGANAIVIAGGANRLVTADDIERAIAATAAGDWLLLQNEINDLNAVLDCARAAGLRVAFNVAPVDGREAGYDPGLVDLLIVNEIEAAALAGATDPRAALDLLTAARPALDVVLTLGGDGLMHARGGSMSIMPAFDVQAVDETAAGDAFIGYLMAALLQDQPLEVALRMGSAAGALAVTRAGAAASVPTHAEVVDFLNAAETR